MNFRFTNELNIGLIVKKSKINEFGKMGEFKLPGLKAKYYMYFPVKAAKYLTVSYVNIEWIPTMSHLLVNVPVTLKVKDSRCSTSAMNLSSLIDISIPANSRGRVETPCAISAPINEVKKGLPFTVDINIPCAIIQPNCEIGKFIFRVGINLGGSPEVFFIRQPTYIADGGVMNQSSTGFSAPLDNIASNPRRLSVEKLAIEYVEGNIPLSALGRGLCEALKPLYI
ncbi:TPA_asm: P3 [Epipactis gammacytorhabdovirus 1]|nr:TPA_asm: P3 [Epipactis gammacytorhabdovirus 1]